MHSKRWQRIFGDEEKRDLFGLYQYQTQIIVNGRFIMPQQLGAIADPLLIIRATAPSCVILFGIQFDDQLFFDILRDLLTSRHADKRSGHIG